jgi:hypothetical protein
MTWCSSTSLPTPCPELPKRLLKVLLTQYGHSRFDCSSSSRHLNPNTPSQALAISRPGSLPPPLSSTASFAIYLRASVTSHPLVQHCDVSSSYCCPFQLSYLALSSNKETQFTLLNTSVFDPMVPGFSMQRVITSTARHRTNCLDSQMHGTLLLLLSIRLE